MNKKIVAVLAAFMMCAVAAFIAVPTSDDVEGDLVTATNANVVVGQSKDVNLFVNTSVFDTAAAITICCGDATNPTTGYTVGNTVIVNDGSSNDLYSYKITETSKGMYTAKITGIAAVSSSDLYVKITVSYLGLDQSKEFKITVKVLDELSGVVAKNSNSVPNTSSAKAKWTAGANVEPVNVIAMIGGTPVTAGDYYYYTASTLPAGVGMKSDGVISGAIPKGTTVGSSYTLQVFVTGKATGFTQMFEVTINCEPVAAESALVYTVTVDGKIYSNDSGATNVVSNGSTIGAIQGKTATISVTKDTYVTMVGPSGTIFAETIEAGTINAATLSTAGTGMYTVTLYDGPITYSFQLYVIGGLVVVADIYVTCS